MLIIFCLYIGLSFSAVEEVVYGNDDRQLVKETTDAFIIDHSPLVALRVDSSQVSELSSKEMLVAPSDYSREVCDYERFSDYKRVGDCTGFLVGPSTLLTAGHCYRQVEECGHNYWIFSFQGTGRQSEVVPQKNIYRCKKVIKRVLDYDKQIDFALIELDGIFSRYFSLSSEAPTRQVPLTVIGYPGGHAQMFQQDIFLRQNDGTKPFFVIPSDTFSGSSGSPVLNQDTGKVVGILVRGEADYEYDSRKDCYRLKRCQEDQCRGEEVQKILDPEILQSKWEH